VKRAEQDAARRLRGEGRSVRDIAEILDVSKGSVSLWVRDIVLTEDQVAALVARNPIYNRQLHGGKARSAASRMRRLASQEEGYLRAQLDESLHVGGCMLYWGEGDKSRNRLSICNSDVRLLAYFLRFLRECYGVPNDRLSVRCQLHDLSRAADAQLHWANGLGIPADAVIIQKVAASRASTRKRRELPWGTCRLAVTKSCCLVQEIFGAIQAYGHFEEPLWLD
jgi:hypothetical protein